MSCTSRLKISVVLDTALGAGGGFNQALNAVLQFRRISEGRFDFRVYTTEQANVGYLKRLGIDAAPFKYSFLDKLLARLRFFGWWQYVQFRLQMIGPLERLMIADGCDLVYFVTPSASALMLQKLNYIITVWDLSHRDTPEFPEIRRFATFYNRETNYRNTLPPAWLILTDSKQLSDLASFRYGVDPERFLPMPFAPAPFLDGSISLATDRVMEKHGLEQAYYYYPAQFWSHKNHSRILEALVALRSEGYRPQVVFSGRDFGNLAHVKSLVESYGLAGQVRFLGFVDVEDVRGLYDGALAVVMPSYFGPTNLPPLEAWMCGTPLIYSMHLSCQAADAALLIDPDSAESIASAMRECCKPDVRDRLVAAGRRRLEELSLQRGLAEQELLERLDRLAVRRRCWGKS